MSKDCTHDFDVPSGIEAVELVDQFEHGPLHLVVASLSVVMPRPADRVHVGDVAPGHAGQQRESSRAPLFTCEGMHVLLSSAFCARESEREGADGAVGASAPRKLSQKRRPSWRYCTHVSVVTHDEQR